MAVKLWTQFSNACLLGVLDIWLNLKLPGPTIWANQNLCLSEPIFLAKLCFFWLCWILLLAIPAYSFKSLTILALPRGLSGAVWSDLQPSEGIWRHLGPSGVIWGHLESSGVIWNHLGLFEAILGCLDTSGAICSHLGSSAVIRNHL